MSAHAEARIVELEAERDAALAREAAMTEIVAAINRNPGDLAPVFDTILAKAHALCGVEIGALGVYENGMFRKVARHGYEGAADEMLSQPYAPSATHAPLFRGEPIHIHDFGTYPWPDPVRARTFYESSGLRAWLEVPLWKDGALLGSISGWRREQRAFSEQEIALLEFFAAQAVMAMENVRLLGELRERTAELAERNDAFAERIEHQAATIDVLKEMSASPGDAQPALETIARHARSLCEATGAVIYSVDGPIMDLVVYLRPDLPEEVIREFRTRWPKRVGEGTTMGPAITERRILHIRDMDAWPEASETARRLAKSAIWVPLMRGDTVIGVIGIDSLKTGGFSDSQVELLQTFAEQAVIAITSAETYRALQDRTAALALRNSEFGERIEQQAATIDVLKTMSASPDDTQPVFDQIARRVQELCNGQTGAVFEYDGTLVHWRSVRNLNPDPPANAQAYRDLWPMPPTRESITCRAILDKQIVHVRDVRTVEGLHWTVQQQSSRSQVSVPMLRDDVVIGAITLAATEPGGFSDSQIALLETFAEQAVIAIGSVATFRALRERTAELAQRQNELRVTFENMGDGVAMFDETQHLVAWNRKFQDILDVPDDIIAQRQTFPEYVRYLAGRGEYGPLADPDEQVHRLIEQAGQARAYERTRPDGRVIEIRHNPVPGGGFVLIYADITERKRNEAAIAAARDAAEAATRTIEAAFRELKIAQANLVQAEKMASLGQLTAGIAHEIKNPLNFVNNFAALSVDLLEELKETAAPGFATLTDDRRADIDDVSAMLTTNLQKITEHGKRADGIVKAMLEHSRGSSGERREVDLNALVDAALNLGYHGARAQDQSFNITLERDYAEGIAPIEVNPQDLTRVFLNLFSNGFYAANKRAKERTEPGFEPVLRVSTGAVNDTVEIRIRDNGTGIPADIRDKLFQPFFTTKPTGEGTGLGLSITYDIVTKQHGGTITVDSEVDVFTEFVVTIPRQMFSGEGERT